MKCPFAWGAAFLLQIDSALLPVKVTPLSCLAVGVLPRLRKTAPSRTSVVVLCQCPSIKTEEALCQWDFNLLTQRFF